MTATTIDAVLRPFPPLPTHLFPPPCENLKKGIPMNCYLCVVCGFFYDEAAGRPEDGIPPGTRWADVPEDWRCPECSVGKADFVISEV